MNNFKRELKLAAPTGTLTVAVTISPPVDRGRYWECQYEIGWPEGKKTSEARGADAVQAIHLAMQAISVHLYASKHHQSGKLYWDRPGQGYGFPMPKVGRAQLVGEDRLEQV